MLDNFSPDDDVQAVEIAMHDVIGTGPVAQIAKEHLAFGGQRIRAKLALKTAARLDLPFEHAVACAACAELLHNASLVHDDMQDGDELRRGHPTAWVTHGRAAALCAGDLMLSAAFGALAPLGPSAAAAIQHAHRAVEATIRGQAHDIAAGRKTPFSPYVRIAQAKSGPLIALAPRLVLVAAGCRGDRDAARAGALIAIGYQISDDLADRDADARANAPNACLALEADGSSEAEARQRAAGYALRALALGARAAHSIPASAGIPLAELAKQVADPLKEIAHAA